MAIQLTTASNPANESLQQGVQAKLPKHGYTLVPWSPWVAVVYATSVFFAAEFIASLLVFVGPKLLGWSDARSAEWVSQNVVGQFLFVLLAESITIAAILWFIRMRHANIRSIGWRRFRIIDLLFALGGFAVYFLVYAALLGATSALIPSLNVNQKQELGFDSTSSVGLGLVLTFIGLVVLPPLAEEIVFRGFVFTGLRGKLKPWLAGIITSIIFATAHLQFGNGKPLLWVAALDTFTLSLVLCYLRHKTGSLWPGILLHGLKNGIAFVALFLLHSQ